MPEPTTANPPDVRRDRQVLAFLRGRSGARLELVASGNECCDVLIGGKVVVTRWPMEQCLDAFMRLAERCGDRTLDQAPNRDVPASVVVRG